MRDHAPITLQQFDGWWARSPIDSCPLNHLSDVNNIKITQRGFKTRDGLNIYLPFKNVLRIYTYIRPTGQSLLVLDNMGYIYDTDSPTPGTPILGPINGMVDFAFVSINGHAFISPNDGVQGLSGEFVYVYKGDGNAARKAGGASPGAGLTAVNSATAGNVEVGTHVVGVMFETDTGFLTPPASFTTVVATGVKKVDFSAIPTGAVGSGVVARRLVSSISIQNYNGDTVGYQLFEIPGGRIADNTTTTLTVNYYDADLVTDASHLLNIFNNISACVGMNVFHNRLVTWSEFGNTEIMRLSYVSEPEAIDQVTGLLDTPLDSHPLTYGQEFRDVLYVYKHDKTFGYPDNGQEPANWKATKVDMGIGTEIHGIGAVLDSSGANIDFLMQITLGGIYIFTGVYAKPELSWKIKDFWTTLNTANFYKFQILVDSIAQLIYVNLLNSTLLVGDYSQGLDPMRIRWYKYTFNIETDSIALINNNQLIIGSQQSA